MKDHTVRGILYLSLCPLSPVWLSRSLSWDSPVWGMISLIPLTTVHNGNGIRKGTTTVREFCRVPRLATQVFHIQDCTTYVRRGSVPERRCCWSCWSCGPQGNFGSMEQVKSLSQPHHGITSHPITSLHFTWAISHRDTQVTSPMGAIITLIWLGAPAMLLTYEPDRSSRPIMPLPALLELSTSRFSL